MEWYFGNEVGDLLVPKNHEQSEKIASLDSWSQLGISPFRGSNFPKKNFHAGTNMTCGELTFNEGKSIYSDDFSHERQNSNNSSMCDGIYHGGGSLLWNDDQADFQQFTDEQARTSHMDDIFLGSLLEEDPTKYSTESPVGNINIFNGEILDSQNLPIQGQSLGISKYLKTHALSPSLEWENVGVSSSCPISEQYASEENTMEESVLQELERVTAQFTEKTRICFRDALYRLAENSKRTVNSCQDGEVMSIANDDKLRVGKIEVSELETNAIDRAVANLMFSKIVFEDEHNRNVEQQQQYSSCCQQLTDLAGDAEVPIFGHHGLAQQTVNLPAY